jgi:hypothetical protein
MLALTSPIIGDRSVGTVCLQTKDQGIFFITYTREIPP